MESYLGSLLTYRKLQNCDLGQFSDSLVSLENLLLSVNSDIELHLAETREQIRLTEQEIKRREILKENNVIKGEDQKVSNVCMGEGRGAVDDERNVVMNYSDDGTFEARDVKNSSIKLNDGGCSRLHDVKSDEEIISSSNYGECQSYVDRERAYITTCVEKLGSQSNCLILQAKFVGRVLMSSLSTCGNALNKLVYPNINLLFLNDRPCDVGIVVQWIGKHFLYLNKVDMYTCICQEASELNIQISTQFLPKSLDHPWVSYPSIITLRPTIGLMSQINPLGLGGLGGDEGNLRRLDCDSSPQPSEAKKKALNLVPDEIVYAYKMLHQILDGLANGNVSEALYWFGKQNNRNREKHFRLMFQLYELQFIQFLRDLHESCDELSVNISNSSGESQRNSAPQVEEPSHIAKKRSIDRGFQSTKSASHEGLISMMRNSDRDDGDDEDHNKIENIMADIGDGKKKKNVLIDFNDNNNNKSNKSIQMATDLMEGKHPDSRFHKLSGSGWNFKNRKETFRYLLEYLRNYLSPFLLKLRPDVSRLVGCLAFCGSSLIDSPYNHIFELSCKRKICPTSQTELRKKFLRAFCFAGTSVPIITRPLEENKKDETSQQKLWESAVCLMEEGIFKDSPRIGYGASGRWNQRKENGRSGCSTWKKRGRRSRSAQGTKDLGSVSGIDQKFIFSKDFSEWKAQQNSVLVFLPTESPLAVAVSAGIIALPQLLDLLTALEKANSNVSDQVALWKSEKKFPLDIDLGPEFHFHTSFTCPICRSQDSSTTCALPCGHVLCRLCVDRMTGRVRRQTMKCPVCPQHASALDIQELRFDWRDIPSLSNFK